MFYKIDGISYSVSVSDNAVVVEGDTSKTDLSLGAGETDSLSFEIKLAEKTPAETDAPETEAPETEAPETEAPETEAPETEAPETEAPETEAPETEAPETEAPSTDTDNSNPNTGIAADGAAIVLCLAAAGVCVWACAKKKTHILSLVLCAAIIGSAVTFAVPAGAEEPAAGTDSAVTDELTDDMPDSFTLEDNYEIDGENVEVTLEITFPQLPEIHDNSEEDIQYLNDGKATILRYENGEVSFIDGKFTDYKVTNYEEATDALQAVNTLLNGDDICVMAVRADKAPNGDVYYTFAQTIDNEAHPGVPCAVVPNAFIKVGVDKDGNTISLTSSLDPTKQNKDGYVDQDSPEMKAVLEDTLTTAQQYAEEHGGKVVDTGDEILVDFRINIGKAVCVLYYIEPATEDSDIVGYTKLYVNIADNQVFDHVPVSEIDYTGRDNIDNDVYYDVETEDMEFTDALGNKVTLPVAKNENGYYFISPERKMIVVDSFTTFNTADTNFILDPVEFASAEDAPKRLVTVFENMIKIYDFYADNGIKSLDGRGLPLLIGYGYYNGLGRDPEGRDVENCGYTSIVNGFGCFMFTDSFDLSNCLDIAAHEFTHGIRFAHNDMGAYYNNTGAVEESIADILGNLIELQLDPNSDTEKWYIAEASGTPMRSLADPHMFAQPEYIGDINFVMNNEHKVSDRNVSMRRQRRRACK